MSKENYIKGKYLEDAVELLEKLIISRNESLKHSIITIEKRKIIKKNGVTNEIDLYVESNPGSNYNSVFIFECKDLKSPVNKNDIIVFSEKINITKAQKGFFVASTFSKDAIAQANTDQRVELLYFSKDEDFESLFKIPLIPIIHSEVTAIDINAKRLSNLDNPDLKIDTDTAELIYKNEKKNFKEFFKFYADEIALTFNHTSELILGDPPIHNTIKKEYKFSEGELFMDGEQIESVIITVSFKIHIVSPQIVTIYDIKNRGRVGTLSYNISSNNNITLNIANTA